MDFKGYQGYQGYKEQGINEMSQGELLLLLYDELVKRLLRAAWPWTRRTTACLRRVWTEAWISSAIWTTPWICNIPSAGT